MHQDDHVCLICFIIMMSFKWKCWDEFGLLQDTAREAPPPTTHQDRRVQWWWGSGEMMTSLPSARPTMRWRSSAVVAMQHTGELVTNLCTTLKLHVCVCVCEREREREKWAEQTTTYENKEEGGRGRGEMKAHTCAAVVLWPRLSLLPWQWTVSMWLGHMSRSCGRALAN